MSISALSGGPTFRVDRIIKSTDPIKGYVRMPTGTDTIVYLSDKAPSISRVLEALPTVLAANEQLIFSVWNKTYNGYVISQVISAS